MGAKSQGKGLYNMNNKVLSILQAVTPEEQRIMNGNDNIQRQIYTDADQFVVQWEKFLKPGEQIVVRKHTRFAYFPPHSHNYVEVFYVISGEITHNVAGHKFTMKEGELLFLSPKVIHEIFPTGENDLAINLIIKPDFFDSVRWMLGRDNIMADFFVDALSQGSESQFLHFPVSNDLCIQNLMENICYALIMDIPNTNYIYKITMGLLCMHLISAAENVHVQEEESSSSIFVHAVDRYVRDAYCTGSLQELSGEVGYSVGTLCRLIKREMNTTFKELQTKRRMEVAANKLRTSDMSVGEIADMVGYTNHSFFYKRFEKEFGMTPSKYRQSRND